MDTISMIPMSVMASAAPQNIITVEWFSIAATIVNLLILFFIIRKFLVKPVSKILDERQALIDKERTEAEKANQDAAQMKQEYEEKVRQIEIERKQALSDAELRGTEEYERIVTEATKKADEIVGDAKLKVELQKRALEAETARQLADLVAAATARVAITEENADLDTDLYDKFLAKAGDIR
ncbi:MAG: ATP synthase F0 subunit B [Lachnospiraceae bacterium]|nr:ATP synthase F0 subunit B [Lachnospiraceae bacterium]